MLSKLSFYTYLLLNAFSPIELILLIPLIFFILNLLSGNTLLLVFGNTALRIFSITGVPNLFVSIRRSLTVCFVFGIALYKLNYKAYNLCLESLTEESKRSELSSLTDSIRLLEFPFNRSTLFGLSVLAAFKIPLGCFVRSDVGFFVFNSRGIDGVLADLPSSLEIDDLLGELTEESSNLSLLSVSIIIKV
jgi:hypothetical protein